MITAHGNIEENAMLRELNENEMEMVSGGAEAPKDEVVVTAQRLPKLRNKPLLWGNGGGGRSSAFGGNGRFHTDVGYELFVIHNAEAAAATPAEDEGKNDPSPCDVATQSLNVAQSNLHGALLPSPRKVGGTVFTIFGLLRLSERVWEAQGDVSFHC